jgi:hypothetical protein
MRIDAPACEEVVFGNSGLQRLQYNGVGCARGLISSPPRQHQHAPIAMVGWYRMAGGECMSLWEYETLSLSDMPPNTTILDRLNDAGRDGWEVVAIMMNGVAVMKRPVPKVAVVKQEAKAQQRVVK